MGYEGMTGCAIYLIKNIRREMRHMHEINKLRREKCALGKVRRFYWCYRRALLESIGKGHDSVGNVLQLPFELGTFGSEFLPTCAHSMPIL